MLCLTVCYTCFIYSFFAVYASATTSSSELNDSPSSTTIIMAFLNTSNGAHKASLNALPDEVLQHILFYLSPQDTVLNVQRISKRFNRLGNEPLLWRFHCRVQFQYWDSKHRIRHKFLGSVGDVDWKTLYTHRKKIDIQITEILDSILEDQVNRIKKFNLIGELGYDAKDTLLRHCHTGEMAEDVLARRYQTVLSLRFTI
jgi:F-box protein 21